MKKITYISPVVEITTWDKADVITTSGVAMVTTVSDIESTGTATVSVSYNDLKN